MMVSMIISMIVVIILLIMIVDNVDEDLNEDAYPWFNLAMEQRSSEIDRYKASRCDIATATMMIKRRQ